MSSFINTVGTIGEYCKVGDGAHASIRRIDSGVPYLMSRNLKNGTLDLTKISYISEADFQKHFKDSGKAVSKVRENDVVFGIIGSLGGAYLVRKLDRFGISSSVAILRPDVSFLFPQYLFYWVQGHIFQDALFGIKGGVAQGYVSLEMIKSLPLAIPPLQAQKRVSEILTAYDALIENNTRRIEILEEMARRLYEEWFVQFRFPGHEDVVFEKMPIHNVADVVRGRSYRSADLAEKGRPFVNLKCINRDGGYRRDGLKYYSGKYGAEQLVRAGDIVMAVTDMTQERRIVARAALVPDLGELEGVISMDLVRIVPKNGIPALYLYAFFRWSDFSDNVKNHATGANVLHLHPDLIANYDIDLPPPEVCQAFAEKVRPAIELADVLEKKNANLRAQRDLLLPKLISGEIDVSDIPMAT